MFGKIARGVTARPWFVIVGWLVAAAAIIALSPGLSRITTSDQSSFVPDTSESSRAAALAATAFPDSHGSTAVIVVKRTDGAPLGPADQLRVAGLAATLNQARPPSVLGVQFDPSQSVSPTRTVALLGVGFSGAPDDRATQDGVAALRATTERTLAGGPLTAGMTGQAAIAVDNQSAFASAEVIVTVASLGLIVLFLLLIFRSPVAALLPLLTVGLVYGVSVSAVAAVGTWLHVTVGQELPTMLTVVLFGIGTDYILFLLFRYRERLRAGDSPREAIVAAVERVGEAIFSAAFAVVAAFGALIFAVLGFFTTLGPALAIGTVVMLVAALTLVPAIVTVLGRRLFWPSRSATRTPTGGGFARAGRIVASRPALVLLGTLLLLGGLAAGMAGFRSDYDPIGQLPSRTEAAQAFQDLQRGFPAGALEPTHVYLRADHVLSQAELGGFVRQLAGVAGVASPLPPTVAGDGRTADVPVVLVDAPYSGRGLDVVSGPLRTAAHAAAPPGATVLVGGESMGLADVRDATTHDLALIFPVAGALFVLILAALLRAVLAPMYLVAMVVAGFAATLGATTLVFQSGLGYAGLAFTIPIILYLFVTAIGTDYNILITARLREEIRDGRSPRDAAELAIAHAGPSVAAAALILAGTFGSLLLSGVPFFVEIGFAVTLGIVLVALVVSLLLVPSATALLGRAAWWPGTRPPTDRDGAGFAVLAPAGREAEVR
jgi:RND superfamily putative drug exporter